MKSSARKNKRKNKERANQRKKQRLTGRCESVYKRTVVPWPTYLGNTMEENVAKSKIDVEAAACEIKAWFPLSQLQPRQRRISSQNKAICVKDDCSTLKSLCLCVVVVAFAV